MALFLLVLSALHNHIGLVQVLKSGEVVCSQLPQQLSAGDTKVEPGLMGQGNPVKVSREGI